METRKGPNKSDLAPDLAPNCKQTPVAGRRVDIGLHWTYELNERFIRARKECEQRFVGKRSGSFPARGWTYVLKQLGIEDKMTPVQAKKKWEMFVSKYRDEEDPTRVGKPPDTAITWPLFPLMQWALADKLALQKSARLYDYQITVEGEVVVNTAPPDEEPVQNEVNPRSAEATPRKRRRQAAAAETPQPPRETPQPPAETPQPHAETPQPSTENPQPPAETPQPSTGVQAPQSVHQRVAAMLDAEDAVRASEVREVRQQLAEVVRLTRAQNEVAREQAESARRTAEALEDIAGSAARQAEALERCVRLAEIRLGLHTVEIEVTAPE